MGFFSKRSRDTDPAGGHGLRHDKGEPYTMSRRPSFGQWLKGTLLDIITMICMGALGLGVS